MDEAIAAMARGDQDMALREASIGDAGAVRLAAALKLNTTITSVYLGSECRAGAGALCARGRLKCAVGVVGRVFQTTASVARVRRPSRRRWR